MTPATAAFARASAEKLPQTLCTFEVSFAPENSRVAHMRRITAAFLRKWDVCGQLAENIVLAVSELVTNAIQHGHGEVRLRVRYAAGELRIEVTDGNPEPAKLRTVGDDEVSGRGLFLIAVLSQDWDVSDDGKTIWCIFRVPAGRP